MLDDNQTRYDQHPYVRDRRAALPDQPFAIVDVLAIANWQASNPDADEEAGRRAFFAPEHVLWTSHPPTDESEPIAFVQVESGQGLFPAIVVLEWSAGV